MLNEPQTQFFIQMAWIVFSECFMGLQPLYKSTNIVWAKIVMVAASSVLGLL